MRKNQSVICDHGQIVNWKLLNLEEISSQSSAGYSIVFRHEVERKITAPIGKTFSKLDEINTMVEYVRPKVNTLGNFKWTKERGFDIAFFNAITSIEQRGLAVCYIKGFRELNSLEIELALARSNNYIPFGPVYGIQLFFNRV